MKRPFSTPLKALGSITIIIGLLASILTLGYLIVLGLLFIGVGLLLFLVDFLVRRYVSVNKMFWSSQILLSTAYLLFAAWVYLKWQEHNEIVFPDNYRGQAGIIFGIEGYPPLPETKFWKKRIEIPSTGIIITSTKENEIPNTVRYSFQKNKLDGYNNIDWDPNHEFDCITTNSRIKAWLFTVNKTADQRVRDEITNICNQINNGKAVSIYKSEGAVIWNDDKGKYLWLQNKNLTSLPNEVSKLDIYKAILTENDLKEIPTPIFEIKNLQELIVGVNPISDIPVDIYKLKRLKSLYVNATNISNIKTDLSKLDSLEHFDISNNNLSVLPEQIKNLPNLKWLSLNNNKFNDLLFIDRRLSKLETLYLYSNNIKKISSETQFLTNLKELLIFDNEIDSIPHNIEDLKSLEKLEIWNNPIKFISPNIKNLKKLKSIRLDDDYLTQSDKENLRNWLPNCEIYFQTRSEKK